MMGSLCYCIVPFMHTLGTAQAAAMVAPLLLTSGLVRCEAALHDYGTSLVCLFSDIATLFQLYHCGDMLNEMRRRKPEPTLLQT